MDCVVAARMFTDSAESIVITGADLLEVQRGLCEGNTAQVKVTETGEVFRIKRDMLEVISDDEITRLRQRRVSLMDKTLGGYP